MNCGLPIADCGLKEAGARMRALHHFSRFFRMLALVSILCCASTTRGEDLFQQGAKAYVAGAFAKSADYFRQAVAAEPSAGGLQNLGNAEWQCGRTGAAILAWERSQWLDPFSANTRGNLRYARKAAQLEAPELAWYEICSAWLPVNAWAWLACLSLWAAVGMMFLPGILRWPRADWHQGVAAAGFAIFLLTIPALAGTHTRSRMGIVLAKDTPLRLTPTKEAQVLAKIPAGESARLERERGNYVFIRTSGAAGWVESGQFGLIACDRGELGKESSTTNKHE